MVMADDLIGRPVGGATHPSPDRHQAKTAGGDAESPTIATTSPHGVVNPVLSGRTPMNGAGGRGIEGRSTTGRSTVAATGDLG